MEENENAVAGALAGEDKRLILVVDDEEVNREILGNILQSRYKVEYAADGQEAMSIIRRDRNVLSIVLLDLFMPKMNGFEVLKAMRADDMLRHIPAMVLTGHKDAEVTSLEQGAYDFITKPFEMPEMILARVSKTIRLAEETYIIRETEKDTLTNLPNVSYFKRLCDSERERMAKGGNAPAFVYFDVMNMKSYNSRYGYEEGDNLLISIAGILLQLFPDMPVCRVSDDHFMVMTRRNGLSNVLAEVRQRVKNAGKNKAVEIHAGIYAEEDSGTLNVITVIDYTRLACATIRGNYNESLRYYDKSLMKNYEDRQYILEHFDQALSERWVKVHYQPIVRATTGKVCNFEALARWVDPVKGMISPGVFIPVVEDYRLGAKMDLYMVEEVCREAEQRRLGGITPVPVSINFSRNDFDELDMVNEIMAIADKYKVPHGMIMVEVTESAFSSNADYLQEQIDRFHKEGFQVWMDDFGDGYASLNVLQKHSFDLIKLDMGFMRNFNATGKNGKILKDIVKMAQHLGIHTLSEGVETEEQFLFLRNIGCEKIQGWYFGKASPTSELLESVQKGTALPMEQPDDHDYYEKNGHFNFADYVSQNIPGSILVYRADGDNDILYANKELTDIFECANMGDFLSLTRHSFKSLVDSDDVLQTEKAIAAQLKEGDGDSFANVSFRIRTKTGKVKKVVTVGHVMHDESFGDIFFTFFYDGMKSDNLWGGGGGLINVD